jgi:glycosyltransferase involved in cell wall biosynthesis
MKVSIIVPVYNLEKYLVRCLDSLLDQDLNESEYEIICINDGSNDSSGDLISDYKNKYANIIYLNQENKGVSAARNAAMKVARGEYLLFVDGDDSLYPNVLKALYENADSNKLDLLYLHIDYYNEAGDQTGSFSVEDTIPEIKEGLNHQRRGFVFGLYRKTSIQTISFVEGIPIGEDALFNIMVHAKAKRCSYLVLPAYKYLVREGSALNSDVRQSLNAFTGYLKTITILLDYVALNETNYDANWKKYFDRPLYKVLEMALQTNIITTLSISRYTTLLKFVKEKKLGYLNKQLRQAVPYFGKPAPIFIGYYGLKKGYNKIFKSNFIIK